MPTVRLILVIRPTKKPSIKIAKAKAAKRTRWRLSGVKSQYMAKTWSLKTRRRLITLALSGLIKARIFSRYAVSFFNISLTYSIGSLPAAANKVA